MSGIIWSELFPTKISIFIFISYMSLFVSQGILVKSSQESNNGYKYNTVTVVLLTEVLKLFISTILYCRTNPFSSLIVNIVKNLNVLLLYFVPAFLYCLYNNLAFINLSHFDPTSYYLLLQFRVVITGILFQIIFKKYLSKKQWFSLVLLTVGCMVKQINFGQDDKTLTTITTTTSTNDKTLNDIGIFYFSINALFILIQTICSCLAGVYNEYLLKTKGADINIYIQNVFMYLDSILCNCVILLMQGNFLNSFTADSLKPVLRFNVIIIMINNAAIGIITSFFLKYMNSILKTFASALELLFTAILCYILFSIPIYINTILAIGIVSFSIYLYSQSPVVNIPPTQQTRTYISHTKKTISSSNDDDSKVSLLNNDIEEV